MTQFGLYSQTTPRNDASPARGQWNLADAYRYISEAYGGYHFNVHARHQRRRRHLHVVRRPVQLLQLRQLGLSAVVRLVEHAVVLQRRARADLPHGEAEDRAVVHQRLAVVRALQQQRPGFGGQILWRPNDKWSILGNQYGLGATLSAFRGARAFTPTTAFSSSTTTVRSSRLSKAALSLTGRRWAARPAAASVASVHGRRAPKQSFLGFMVYNRFWFDRDKYRPDAGRWRDQQSRPLPRPAAADQRRDRSLRHAVLHRESRRPLQGLGRVGNLRLHAEPVHHLRLEYNHRAANVPYFSGPGGVTPPGGNTGVRPARSWQAGRRTCATAKTA